VRDAEIIFVSVRFKVRVFPAERRVLQFSEKTPGSWRNLPCRARGVVLASLLTRTWLNPEPQRRSTRRPRSTVLAKDELLISRIGRVLLVPSVGQRCPGRHFSTTSKLWSRRARCIRPPATTRARNGMRASPFSTVTRKACSCVREIDVWQQQHQQQTAATAAHACKHGRSIRLEALPQDVAPLSIECWSRCQ
jgi:hypothetical protein